MSRPSLGQQALDLLYGTFRKDIGRKLIALLLALVVWVYVAEKVVNSQTYRLAIRVVNGREAFIAESAKVEQGFFVILPENVMEIRGEDDATLIEDQILQVTLSGPRERLPRKLVGSYEIFAQRHLGALDERQLSIAIMAEYFNDLGEGSGIRASFNPSVIDLRLARRKELKLLLTAESNLTIQNTLPPDLGLIYDASFVAFDPNPVEIQGPSPAIEAIRGNPALFKLEEIDISNARKDSTIQLTCSREMRDNNISLRTRDGLVNVNLGIQEKEIQRELVGVPVVLFDKGRPLRAEDVERIAPDPDQDTIALDLKGPGGVLNALTDEQLRGMILAVIDLGGRRVKDTYDIGLMRQANLPDAIRISFRDEPKMVVRFTEPFYTPEP